MANSYKYNKFRSDFQKAVIEGDATKSTVSLDDNYEEALAQMKSVINGINKHLDTIKARINELNKHKDTGIEAQRATRQAAKKIEAVKTSLNNTLNKFSNVINTAEKAELQRMKQWYREQMAVQAKSQDSTIG